MKLGEEIIKTLNFVPYDYRISIVRGIRNEFIFHPLQYNRAISRSLKLKDLM